MQSIIFDNFNRLFRKTPASEPFKITVPEKEKDATDFSRIRCPLCRWQPRRFDRWMCADSPFLERFFGGCYTSWNTFETRGLCPGCSHQWLWTTCLACGRDSLHEDWYAEEKEI